MSTLEQFLNSYFLWKEALAAGVLLGALCGFVGVYVVLRRMIFVSAALTQVSGLGVAAGFYLQAAAAGGLAASIFTPEVVSIFVALLTAYLFAFKTHSVKLSAEGLIGLLFIAASALVVIVGDMITQGSHDIADIIFGSAVIVSLQDLYLVISAFILLAVLFVVLYKDFLFISFDPDSAMLAGYPVKLLNILLFLGIGVLISIGTKTIGALPVFGFLTVPALSALQLSEKIGHIFIISVLVGAFSAILGYFFSFVFSIPTGACITMTTCIFLVLSFVLVKVKRLIT